MITAPQIEAQLRTHLDIDPRFFCMCPSLTLPEQELSLTGARAYESGDPTSLLIHSRGAHPYYVRAPDPSPLEYRLCVLDPYIEISPDFRDQAGQYLTLFDTQRVFGYRWRMSPPSEQNKARYCGLSLHGYYHQQRAVIELRTHKKSYILPTSWISPHHAIPSTHRSRYSLADWIYSARDWALDRYHQRDTDTPRDDEHTR